MIATTFLALGNTNLEEQDKTQLEMDFIDEQLEVIGRVFMGQTIGCARCHDHKFDPIPTSDYYALAGIFRASQAMEHENVSKWVERPLPTEPEIEQRMHEAAAALKQIVAEEKRIEKLIGKKPILGICLGHQILGLALGGRCKKLKFGHHGGNHPVRRLETGAVEITSQNHNYAVSEGAIPGADVSHVNLNDGVVEGLRCRDVPAFSVQYHPEAGPGPHDARYLFAQFKDLMERGA